MRNAKKITTFFAVSFIFIILLLGSCSKNSSISGNVVKNTSLSDKSDNVPEENQPAQIEGIVANISEVNSSNTNSNNSSNGKKDVDITAVLADNNLSKTDSETAAGNDTDDNISYWGKLTVSFIDVGYGDSTFILTPHNGTMLVDGGTDECGAKLTRYLRNYGIFYYLDTIIATNPTKEHIGALDSILFNMLQVDESYDTGEGSDYQGYQAFNEMARSKGMYLVLDKDAEVNIDKDIKIELIAPYKDGFFNNTYDNSIVVKVIYSNVSFLLMSDCSAECQKKLEGYNLEADILKLSHYGADEATSEKLLDEVRPNVAVISVGKNEIGCPSSELIQRLEKRGIQVLRTDINGTIVVDSNGKTYSITTEK